MKYALLGAWIRFKEIRFQQKVKGYSGPLSIYAAFYAEKGDWEKVFTKSNLLFPPNLVIVDDVPMGRGFDILTNSQKE